MPWDRQRIRQELDLAEVVKILGERFGAVPDATGMIHGDLGEQSRDFWFMTKKRCDALETWLQTKSASTAASKGREGNANASDYGSNGIMAEPGQLHMKDYDPTNMQMEFLDDVWTRNLLSGDSDFSLETFW